MTPSRIAAVAWLVAALVASTTWAQTSLDAEISRGVALRRVGQDEAARAVFQAAWRSSQAPRALAQLSLAEQALGRWVAAEAHLVEALRATGDPWVASHVPILRSALAEIRLHLGDLSLVGGPDGSEVVLDGDVVGTLPLAAMLRVPTGSVTFTVRRDGFIPATRTVQVEGRYPLREQVALARAAPTDATLAVVEASSERAVLSRRPEEASTPALRASGYGLVGVGIAALAVSGVLVGVNVIAVDGARSATPTSAEPYGAWARFQASENRGAPRTGSEQCDLAQLRTSADAAQVRDLCDRVSTSAMVALVSGIAGGVLLATGVVFAVVARPSAPAPSAARWALSPWLAAGSGGASLLGRW